MKATPKFKKPPKSRQRKPKQEVPSNRPFWYEPEQKILSAPVPMVLVKERDLEGKFLLVWAWLSSPGYYNYCFSEKEAIKAIESGWTDIRQDVYFSWEKYLFPFENWPLCEAYEKEVKETLEQLNKKGNDLIKELGK